MSDISMCLNKDCKSKNNCYRFTSKPNEFRQSYSKFNPNKKGKCEYFIDNKR